MFKNDNLDTYTLQYNKLVPTCTKHKINIRSVTQISKISIYSFSILRPNGLPRTDNM